MKKLDLLSLLIVTLLVFSLGSVTAVSASSDGDFYSPVDDSFYPPADGDSLGGGSCTSCDGSGNDFYPPVTPPGDDDFYPPAPVCGNGVCESGEDSLSCPIDCDADFYPPAPVCGNGICELGENEFSCPADCAVVPPPPEPEPVNNPPVIAVFNVPPTAEKNTDITLSVTATDGDGGVNRIEILKQGVVISTQSCGNILSCTKSFIVRVPDAFDAVYTFVARVFDSVGASASKSGSGKTNAAPVTPPPVTPSFPPEKPVRVSIPSDELFISSVVPDTACLAPGAETFLYVSLKNIGKRSIDDLKVTAVVPELNIRAVSGPFLLRKGDSASRFLYFIVPDDAKSGEYYIKALVTSEDASVVKYRVFEVNKAC